MENHGFWPASKLVCLKIGHRPLRMTISKYWENDDKPMDLYTLQWINTNMEIHDNPPVIDHFLRFPYWVFHLVREKWRCVGYSNPFHPHPNMPKAFGHAALTGLEAWSLPVVKKIFTDTLDWLDLCGWSLWIHLNHLHKKNVKVLHSQGVFSVILIKMGFYQRKSGVH